MDHRKVSSNGMLPPPEAPIPKLVKIADGYPDDYLDCLMCSQIINKNIQWYECIQGHKTCGSCMAATLGPPVCYHLDAQRGFYCSQPYNYIRIFPAEFVRLYNSSQISCRYTTYGCTEVVLGEFLRNHELICSFSPYKKDEPISSGTICKTEKEEPVSTETVCKIEKEEPVFSKPTEFILDYAARNPDHTDKDLADELEISVEELREIIGIKDYAFYTLLR